MKNINYENLKSDEHVCHSWSILDFKIDDYYEYISNNLLLNLISTIIILPVALILYIFDKIFSALTEINTE